MHFFALYIDPTAAGLGLQMLLAGAVGGLVTIKLFWGRFFSLFRRTRQDTEESLDSTEESPEKAMDQESSPHP